MNRATRMLTLLGMGLMAGATLGATPALAADSAAPSTAKTSSVVKADRHWGNERIVGYYRTLRACERAGWIGERLNRFDDHDCERVRFGFRRGMWALEVRQDRDWGRPGHGHGHGHRPWGGDDRPWGGDHRPGPWNAHR